MKFYDMEGQPISEGEWHRLFRQHVSTRVIASDYMGGDDNVHVSTVWIGGDQSYDPDGPPLIFETKVFRGEHGGDLWRYSTKEEALEGHRRVVAQVRPDGR